MGLFSWLLGTVKVSTVNQININATEALNQTDKIMTNQQAIFERTLTVQQKQFFHGVKTVISDATTSMEILIKDVDQLISKQRADFFSDMDKTIDNTMEKTKDLIDHATNRTLIVGSRVPGTSKTPISLKFMSEVASTQGLVSIKFKGYFPAESKYTYYLTLGDDTIKETRLVLVPTTQMIDSIEFNFPLCISEEDIAYITNKKVLRLPIKFAYETEGWISFIEGLLCKNYLNIVY